MSSSMFTDWVCGVRPFGRGYCGFLKELDLGGLCSRGARCMYGDRTPLTPQGER